jgi:hypothetical protein
VVSDGKTVARSPWRSGTGGLCLVYVWPRKEAAPVTDSSSDDLDGPVLSSKKRERSQREKGYVLKTYSIPLLQKIKTCLKKEMKIESPTN